MDMVHRILYTALGAASLLFIFVKLSLSHWKNRGILHERPSFFWGNLKGVGSKIHVSQPIQEIYTKYQGQAPFVGCYAFLKPLILVLDLNLIKNVLQKHSDHFLDRGLYHNMSGDPLSCNLIQLDNENWHHLRQSLQPKFTSEQIQTLMPTLLQVASEFKRSLDVKHDGEEGQVYDINKLVDKYNVAVISTLAFGLENDEIQQSRKEFRTMTRSYLKNYSLTKAYLAWSYPNMARLFNYRSYDELATNYFMKLVQQKLVQRERSHTEPKSDFLTLCTQSRQQPNEGRNQLGHKQIAAQAFSFISAGLEACNSTLTFCLYELAFQPDVQDRARAEINSVLKRHDDRINYDSLMDMLYLRQILYETLRKHSPYPFLLRKVVKDFEVPNSVFMLQKHNELVIPILAIHNDPRIYPNPQLFDPERFQPATIQQRDRMAWLPFGAGPRNCIAFQFAELQLLLGLVTLLRHYRFSTCSQTIIPLQYDKSRLVLAPNTEILLRMERAKY